MKDEPTKPTQAIHTILGVCGSVVVGRPQKDGTQALIDAVRTLDIYMTGKTTARNLIDDSKAAQQLAEYGEGWLVYLSDGGYTRVMIDPVAEPNQMWVTGSSGHYDWDSIKAKWDAIYKTY